MPRLGKNEGESRERSLKVEFGKESAEAENKKVTVEGS